MKLFDTLKQKSRALKKEIIALLLAAKRPKVPWYAKAFTAVIVAYALSPIDLIPDFIPVLGYLDDLILIPLGIALAIKMIPAEVMAECRKEAEVLVLSKKPVNWIAGAVIIGIWIFIVYRIVLGLFGA